MIKKGQKQPDRTETLRNPKTGEVVKNPKTGKPMKVKVYS